MTLSPDDVQLFYFLWFQLLDYANCKRQILPGKRHLELLDFMAIADVIWEDVSIIDEFLEDCAEELEPSHIEIVRGWKRRIRGSFVLERHLQKGSIFISMDNQQVYLVKGLVESWREMLRGAPIPLAMDATLIPFKDSLITDGLVMPYAAAFGRNMVEELKDIYRTAKRNGSIHTTL
ncbi:MAG: hypothetical protein Q4F17_01625 [Eubacteriales bacterium]|nr:hypothetical protein [Eubacteriales bacterium]